MRFSLVPAALLCFTTWMNVVHATHAPVSNCCLRWSEPNVNRLKQIVNYTVQTEGICPITAVVFRTKRGKSICSDPNSVFAKKGILKVEEERRHQAALGVTARNEGLTSDDTPPTVSLPLKTTPKKKGRNGRRRPKKSRGRKRSQKKSV